MTNLSSQSQQFFSWIYDWYKQIPSVSISQFKDHSEKVAIVIEDMLVGFCHDGVLSSKNVQSIIPDVVGLITKLHEAGVRHFLSFQDTHDPHAKEFETYPVHCVRGTKESDIIPELKNLPFYQKFKTFEKNSLSSFWGTGFTQWIDDHPEIDTYIIAGDCTDICVYQAVVGLRTLADQSNKHVRIIVPANCVATYDMSVETAKKIGALPHDANLLHLFFLYHMKLNGVEVVKEITRERLV